jgi:hypothetical protein
MVERNTTKRAIMMAALGLSLFGGAASYAIAAAEHPTSERSAIRNMDLTGGFYDDRYTVDDWFYDFYEAPADRTDLRTADRTDLRTADRTRVRDTDPIIRAERDRWADAAHPIQASREVRRPSTANTVYSRYYDDPWFYEQRDPLYDMPTTMARSDSPYQPAARDEEYVKGTVQAVKQVRNRHSGGQNTVALLKLNDGRRVVADLGPTQRTLHLALTQGDSIQVGGQREEIGPYSVLMAHDIKAGANRVRVNRDVTWREADYRQVDGRIDRFRDIKTRPDGQLHRTAAVRTDDGHFAIVDMGPSPAENVPANAAPGDHISAKGQVVQVGNYPVLLADQLSINNGLPVRVVRSDSEYIDPTRRPFEATQSESATDPSCVGAGCEAGTVNRSTPRNPLSNAMDGDIGSERR